MVGLAELVLSCNVASDGTPVLTTWHVVSGYRVTAVSSSVMLPAKYGFMVLAVRLSGVKPRYISNS